MRQLANRVATLLERTIDVLTGGAVAVMALAISYQVFGRYVLGHSPSWSEELSRYLMVWLTMLGAAAAMRGGGHIAVTTLVDTLSPRGRSIALALRDVALVCTCGVLAWWGFGFAAQNAAQESAAMDIPMSIPYAALPTGAVLIALLVLLARLAGTPAAAGSDETF